MAQSAALTEQIHEQLATHVDGDIFTSLPRAGRVWAARLRVEIGDARGRYPTPEALVCAAGIRLPLRRLVQLSVPGLPVLSYTELSASSVTVNALGMIDVVSNLVP